MDETTKQGGPAAPRQDERTVPDRGETAVDKVVTLMPRSRPARPVPKPLPPDDDPGPQAA